MLKQLLFLLETKRQKFLIAIIFLVLIGTLIEITALANIYKLIEVLIDQSQNKFYISIISKEYIFDKLLLIKILTFTLIIIYIFKFFFFNFLNYLQFNFVYNFRHHISKRLISKYLDFKYLDFIKKKHSEMVRNIDKEAAISADGVLLNVISMVTEIIILIGILSFLLFVEFSSTLKVILLLLILSFLFYYVFKKKIFNYGKLKQKISSEFLKDILQSINGYKDIKIYNKEKFFLDRFSISSKNLAKISTKQVFIYSLSRYSIELILIIVISTFIFYSINTNKDLDSIFLTIGIYAAAAFRVIPSLNKIIGSAQRLESSKPSVNLIYNELNNNFSNIINQNNVKFTFKESIKLENISFNYPLSDEKIINKINLEIKRDEITAIVGRSGCGKSTLVDIISGLIKPVSGNIFLDKKKINEQYNQISSNISYLSQKFFLLNDTILNNILFGSDQKNINYELIEKILSELQIENLIKSSPLGLNRIIEEDGIDLSGGQGQRVALARCFYADRDIVILDEATSALDIYTENSILNLIKKMKKNKAIIIVSHRENVLEFADNIIKLNSDKVIK